MAQTAETHLNRLADAAASGVLYRHHAEVTVTLADLVEDRPYISDRLVFDALTEFEHRRCVTETALRT